MIVLVTGGRDYADREAVWRELDALAPDVVAHGAYPGGADAHADAWAQTHGVPSARFPVSKEEWRRKGKRAGPERNQVMVNDVAEALGKFDVIVLAFPGGRGTADCVRGAREAGLEVREVGR